jgi:hypothetical protein
MMGHAGNDDTGETSHGLGLATGVEAVK